MKIAIRAFVVIICMSFIGCAAFNQLSPIQKAEYAAVQGKRVESYYRDVVVLYKAVYDKYQTDPSDENRQKLIEMQYVHTSVANMYEQYRNVHNKLITAIQLFKTGNSSEEELMALADLTTSLVREIVIQSSVK